MDSVLIIGAGPIGLATLEFTRLTGAQVTVMDQVESRLEFCRETYGVAHTIQFKGDGSEMELVKEYTNGARYSVVFDATGSDKSMSYALNYAAHTGVLVYVGITTQELKFVHPTMHKPELDIRASRNALPRDFGRIISLIEGGVIDTDPWITHRVAFDGMIDAFEGYTRPETGVIKAVVSVSED